MLISYYCYYYYYYRRLKLSSSRSAAVVNAGTGPVFSLLFWLLFACYPTWLEFLNGIESLAWFAFNTLISCSRLSFSYSNCLLLSDNRYNSLYNFSTSLSLMSSSSLYLLSSLCAPTVSSSCSLSLSPSIYKGLLPNEAINLSASSILS